MSLQVWLPLNGNLNNQGTNPMIFTNRGADTAVVSVASGKIGSCYSRGTYRTGGRIRSSDTINLSSDLTMACWAYVMNCVGDTANGLVSNHSHEHNTGVGITVKQVSTSDYRISCNTGTGSSRTYCSYYGTTNIKNAWHHLCLTYSKSAAQLKLWVNGVCEYTLNNYSNASRDDYIDLFNWSTTYGGVDYEPAVKLNDVRIYDNCLSAAEIKDLAKGLVAHYSLTDCMPYTNLAKNSTYVIYNNYGVSASLTKLSEQFGKCDVYRLTMTPTDGSLDSFKNVLHSHGVYNFYRTFAASTKYCFWIYYRPVTHFDIRVGGIASNIGGWIEIEPKYYGSGWYRVGQYRDGSVTSAKTDNIFTSFYTPTAAVGVPISIDFCCPHLVEGYDYILEDGDYQQTTLNYNISDSSGYKYTGSTSSSVAPIAVETSPRSNRSLYFNSTSKNLTLNASFLPTFTTGSVSFWAKVNAKGSSGILPFTGQTTSYYLMASENWTGGFYNGGVSAAGTITYYVDGVVDNTPSGVDGIWHHYCVTGVNMSAWTALKLNNYAASWNGASIYYSDIRFYNTVLSAADVADLANAPIKIASNGTLITNGEVVE